MSASSPQRTGDAFLRSLWRRQAVTAAGGAVSVVVGGTLAGVAGGLAAWFIGLAAFGLLVLGAAAIQGRLLRDARGLLDEVPQTMQLFTWPYRSVRSPVRNRVLVTLDLPASVERTPLAEFTALSWTSDGAGARGDEAMPGRPAQVFGAIRRGQVVLAVTEDGSCFVGRISQTPRSAQAARQR